MKLQTTINKLNDWAKKWKIKTNQSKSMHITFTVRKQTCPTVQMGNVNLPQNNGVKYLSMHLDIKLTSAKQLNQKVKHIHWLLRKTALSMQNVKL
jgi:hypothetical protein